MSDKRARANQYAQAVMQAMVERWQESLRTAGAALAGDAKLAVAVADRSRSAEERTRSLTVALPAETPDEIANLLKLLVQEGDIDLLPEISRALQGLAVGRQAPLKAEVISAVELSAAEQDQLRQQLTQQYGEGIHFSFAVDPSLLGGLRVRVGDRLIDNSVASRLAELRESISSVVR